MINSKVKAKSTLSTKAKKSKLTPSVPAEETEYRMHFLEADDCTKKDHLEYYEGRVYWPEREFAPFARRAQIIDEIEVRWEYINGKYDKSAQAILYGTPGTKKVNGVDVDCVLQFFLYYDSHIWKPRSILHCMSIIKSIVYCEGILKMS